MVLAHVIKVSLSWITFYCHTAASEYWEPRTPTVCGFPEPTTCWCCSFLFFELPSFSFHRKENQKRRSPQGEASGFGQGQPPGSLQPDDRAAPGEARMRDCGPLFGAVEVRGVRTGGLVSENGKPIKMVHSCFPIVAEHKLVCLGFCTLLTLVEREIDHMESPLG